MNFSEFAKTLYPYCANGSKQTEFVILLTDKIMGGQPDRAHKNERYQNPLRNKDERTLLSYFSSERYISQGDARIILSHIDKYKFEQHLQHQCSNDSLELLAKDLSTVEEINDKH